MKALEKRIKERAAKRFDNEVRRFLSDVNKTEFGRKLKINLPDQNKGEDGNGEPGLVCIHDDYNPALFVGASRAEQAEHHSNYLELKEELIAKYEKEEADAILNKIDILQHYLRTQ